MNAARIVVLVALAVLACASIGRAGEGMRRAIDANRLIVEADWQLPQSLLRRFRNHCSYDGFGRRTYCSDHCGYDYQFYYCSRASFGCCGFGLGYCDWQGLLRCHP